MGRSILLRKTGSDTVSTWRSLVFIAIVVGGCLGSIAGLAMSELLPADTIRPFLPPASFDDDPASTRETDRRANLFGRTVGITLGLAVGSLVIAWRSSSVSVASRVQTVCMGLAAGVPADIACVLINPIGNEVSLGSNIAIHTSAFLITGLVTAAFSRRPFLSGAIAGVLTMANLVFLVAPPDPWGVLWLMICSITGLGGGVLTAFVFLLLTWKFSAPSKNTSKQS
jgi:hypothetical protein